MSCSLPPPPLSLAHWQGGTSEPHYCRRIYEAEPNGKEKASVNNCRELHSQLWNLIKYAVIRHKDQKHYSTPTESYGGTLISNRPTVQKKKNRLPLTPAQPTNQKKHSPSLQKKIIPSIWDWSSTWNKREKKNQLRQSWRWREKRKKLSKLRRMSALALITRAYTVPRPFIIPAIKNRLCVTDGWLMAASLEQPRQASRRPLLRSGPPATGLT